MYRINNCRLCNRIINNTNNNTNQRIATITNNRTITTKINSTNSTYKYNGPHTFYTNNYNKSQSIPQLLLINYYRSFTTNNNNNINESTNSTANVTNENNSINESASSTSDQINSPELTSESFYKPNLSRDIIRDLKYVLRSNSFKKLLFQQDSTMTEVLYRANILPFVEYIQDKSNTVIASQLEQILLEIKANPTDMAIRSEIVEIFLKFIDDSVNESTDQEVLTANDIQQPVRDLLSQSPLYSKLMSQIKLANTTIAGIDQPPKKSLKLQRTASGKVRYDPNLDLLANLKQPHEWFPAARSIKRKIIIHVGPTNSGKTYKALQKLIEAESGAYAGPLRLLAWEVHETITKAGVHCNLLTGQETIREPGARHVSSTVEMIDTERIIDVGVIDEMQMIGSDDRGFAWSRALLGLPARELHICGDPSMLKIVEEICSITGESFTINEYKRLTKLELSPPLTNGLRDIRKGDAVIAFGRQSLYSVKKQIELQTGLKCCIIYGSLPPETRKIQAELFNNPDNDYHVLVASDAIGMGLNLNIGRIVFSDISKFDGNSTRELTTAEALQIGGRAGRFRSKYDKGYVTTLEQEDYPKLKRIIQGKLTSVDKAGLTPQLEQIEIFSREKPRESLSIILDYMKQYASIENIYFMCDMTSIQDIANTIQSFKLTLQDRYSFCLAPANMDKLSHQQAIINFVKQFTEQKKVTLQSIQPRLYILKKSTINSTKDIELLEDLYAQLDIYTWLARRFNIEQEIFTDLIKANELRMVTGGKIADALQNLHPPQRNLNKIKKSLYHERLQQKSFINSDSNIDYDNNNPHSGNHNKHYKPIRNIDISTIQRIHEPSIHHISKSKQKHLIQDNQALAQTPLPE